jgi:hypothetical protein
MPCPHAVDAVAFGVSECPVGGTLADKGPQQIGTCACRLIFRVPEEQNQSELTYHWQRQVFGDQQIADRPVYAQDLPIITIRNIRRLGSELCDARPWRNIPGELRGFGVYCQTATRSQPSGSCTLQELYSLLTRGLLSVD